MGELKERIEEQKFIIVCDTNVLLNIYRYSPEFSEFSLKCMEKIKKYIILPSTVRLEYLKHYRASFGMMQKKVKNASCETRNQILTAKRKILNTCDTLETFHYPDISELKNVILSPGAAHEFKGIVEVEVIREADIFLDFEADNGFESAKIIRAVLQETKYEPYMDYDEPLDGAYNTCPDCGCQINFDNDGGNGFCSDCNK